MSPRISLLLDSQLSPARFGEVGRPAGAYERGDGQVVGLVSDFERLYWPGRALYEGHRLRHRICLYANGFADRIAVFDGAGFPINDVAFHPTEPTLAIASGSYDGGYLFEGELLLWNWETGASWSVLSASREVSRVRFTGPTTLAVLLRPRDDDEYGEDAALDTFVGGVIHDLRPFAEIGLRSGEADPRLTSFAPVSPESLGFDVGFVEPAFRRAHWDALLSSTSFELRHRVWDIKWTGEDRIATVHDGCRVEEWNTAGERLVDMRGAGHGIQLFARGATLLVNVLERGDVFNQIRDRSTLIELNGGAVTRLAEFDHAVLATVDRSGRVLLRDTGDLMRHRARRDIVLDATGGTVLERDLGAYDCFNHYVRLDGGEGLYFLRGRPVSSHANKTLCRIGPSGDVDECFSWDDPRRHSMCSTACLLPDGSMVRSYVVHDSRPSAGERWVERLDASGRTLWSRNVPAPATTLEPFTDEPRLAYALTDGTLGLLDWVTGAVLDEQQVAIDGIPTMILSACARGARLACGTIDGRVLTFRIHRNA